MFRLLLLTAALLLGCSGCRGSEARSAKGGERQGSPPPTTPETVRGPVGGSEPAPVEVPPSGGGAEAVSEAFAREAEAPTLRPISPLSGSRIRLRRPMLRWEAPEGLESHVQLCATSSCRRLLGEVRGEGEGTPSDELPTGRTYWRVRSGDEFSATWMIDIRPSGREGAVQAVSGDLSGDGYADAFVSRTLGPPPYDTAWLYRGSSEGIRLEGEGPFAAGRGRMGHGSDARMLRGDVNGDGRVDLFLGSALFLATANGIDLGSPSTTLDGNQRLYVLADVNGDGFEDAVRARPYADTSVEPALGTLLIHLASREGLSSGASQSLAAPGASLRLLGSELSALGDVNGDGYDDVLAVGREAGSRSGSGEMSLTEPLRLLIFLGGESGLDWARRVELRAEGETSLSAAPSAAVWNLQYAVAEGFGDINGDGYDDFGLSMRLAGNDYETRTYLGGTDSLVLSEQGQEQRYLRNVGDVDGDGFPDRVSNSVIASPLLHFGGPGSRSERLAQRAGSVASPGDIDGDGYADLLVGDGKVARLYYGGPPPLFVRVDAVIRASAQGGDSMGFADWVR